MNLFEFDANNRRDVFAVAWPAPRFRLEVDQEQAARRALDWAHKFYGVRNLDLVEIPFKRARIYSSQECS